MISGGSYYQLLGDNGAVTLRHSSNHVGWNDDTDALWDVTAAKNNSSSFQVLFEGAGSKDGRILSGLLMKMVFILTPVGLLMRKQPSDGYENTFTRDLIMMD